MHDLDRCEDGISFSLLQKVGLVSLDNRRDGCAELLCRDVSAEVACLTRSLCLSF